MNEVVQRALRHWGLAGAGVTLVAARENAVYRADHNGRSYALRVHRKGYRNDAELWSELQWMAIFEGTEISVPTPVAASDGAFLKVVDGVQVDVLGWLSGAPLVDLEQQLSTDQRKAIFARLGRDMALMHHRSDGWARPDSFTRWSWDRAGLVGAAPLWDRFWENPQLTLDQRRLLVAFRDRADQTLAQMEGTLDDGLIHADLVSANVMVDGDRLHLIDFDDGGFGFRMFDVVTALFKFMEDADYPDLKAALLDGYTRVRPLAPDAFDLFTALRAATYVGWNISRMDEDGGKARNARFIEKACRCAQAYLAG